MNMSTFTFEAGKAVRLQNGTMAEIQGNADIGGGQIAGFLVELSSTRDRTHISGLCTLKRAFQPAMAAGESRAFAVLEEEIATAAIAGYRDWLNGADSVLDTTLGSLDGKPISSH